MPCELGVERCRLGRVPAIRDSARLRYRPGKRRNTIPSSVAGNVYIGAPRAAPTAGGLTWKAGPPMQDERNRGHARPLQQDVLEHAVLNQLLAAHPVVLTIAELKRQFTEEVEDSVDVAISALDAAGLVNVRGDLVLASHAAARCAALLALQ